MEVTLKTLATMVKTDTYYFKPCQAGGHGPLLAGQGIEPRTCTHHIPQNLRWNRTNSRMCLSYIASTYSATCYVL